MLKNQINMNIRNLITFAGFSAILLVSCGEESTSEVNNHIVKKDSTVQDRTEKIENIFFNIHLQLRL